MAAVTTGVIYLQKDKFQFYIPTIGRVVEFRFVPEIVRDLDILNSELLENYIKVFVTNGKIPPCSLIFILSENAYFTKDFVPPALQKGATSQPTVTKELLQKEAEEFIEHVPFDNVVSKALPLKDGMKIIATNKDFYESIAIAFEHLGFTVESVFPGLVFGNGLSLRPVMDPPMANVILQKASAMRQYNLLNQQAYQPLVKQETEEVDEVEIESKEPKKTSKQTIYALAVIVLILLILGVVLYQQFQSSSPKQKPFTSSQTPVIVKPTIAAASAVPIVTTASSSGNLQAQNLAVQVVNASGTNTTAQQLVGQLETLRFKSVSLTTSSSVGSSSTLVTFTPSVSQDVRNSVLIQVKKFESNVLVEEKQIGTYDISIVLGQ